MIKALKDFGLVVLMFIFVLAFQPLNGPLELLSGAVLTGFTLIFVPLRSHLAQLLITFTFTMMLLLYNSLTNPERNLRKCLEQLDQENFGSLQK